PPTPIAARTACWRSSARARDAEAGLPIGEILLVEARQQSRHRVAGAVERSHGAELVGGVLIVLIGDELPLGLAQAARQRLLVEAREIAAGAGEHAVHLIGDVGVGVG